MRKLKFLLSGIVRRFTMIEILIVMVLMMVLAGLLMPAIHESRKKAKFIRWYGFNNTLSRDATCAMNFNFQDAAQLFDETQGVTPFSSYDNPYVPEDVYCVQDTGSATGGGQPCIKNTAAGCEAERFILENYHGYLRKDAGLFTESIAPDDPSVYKDCFELSPGGRWGRYKKALKFDGKKAFIDVPADEAIDYTPNDSFTINMWVKFNSRNLGDGLFSKCKWGFLVSEDHPKYDELCSSAQYDMYVTAENSYSGNGVYDVDVFTNCYTANEGHIEIAKTYEWHMLTLRYDATGETTRGYVDPNTGQEYTDVRPGCSTIFINGEVANDKNLLPPNNASGIYDADNWAQSASGEQHFLLGAIGMKPARDKAEVDYFFDGEMDEMNMFRRAMTNAEIKGMYEMGAE